MVWRPFLAPRFDLPAAASAAPAELPKGHIPALDAIRGLAIVIVTLYRFGGGNEGPARAIEHVWLIELGQRGVDLFFVLSGFLITGILFDAKGQEHYFRNFYVRRALRIFPLYYGALATAILIPPLIPALAAAFQPATEAQTWLWLYGANVLQAYKGQWCLGALNHFWSLAIEEHFYLAWPAVIYFTSRRTALRICGGLFAASIVARAAWLAGGGNDVAADVLTPLRMDGLVLGSWLALAARSPGGLAWLARWATPTLLAFGAAAVAADFSGRRLFGLPSTAWACGCGAFLILTVAAPRTSSLGRFAQSNVLQFFGKYSYAMYVFQLPLIFLLAPVVTAPGLASLFGSAVIGQFAYCTILFIATTLCALASWNLFEKRLLALKHRFGG
jgi:peptidoglycan/LPS O-acetylase OafA/YrhL